MIASPVIPSPTEPPPHEFARLPRLTWLNLALLAGLLTALIGVLWPHWRNNPDLAHGYVTPLIFLLLLREARAGTPRYLSAARWQGWLQGALLGMGLLLIFASGLYAAALDWSHSLVAFTLTAALTFILAGALVSFASTRLRLVPLNWTALVAIGVWLFSAPIPPGTYSRLMLALQLAVTENVLRALHLLGIAAQRHGNVIELATTSVGIEEACSGIRSLVSCVFAGVLFSATLVRQPWARALVIGLAAPLAIGMNFARSLTLTLLANAGVDIAGRWHDFTGFAVLALTALLLAGLALLLERRHVPPATATAPIPAAAGGLAEDHTLAHDRSPLPIGRSLQLPLAVASVLAVLLAVFFAANTRPSARQGLPPPDLLAILPARSPGWHVQTSDNLYQFSATLQTEHLAQRTYTRVRGDLVEQVTIYLAYWPAGQAPVSLVASHTPDACWPGSGWAPVSLHQTPAEFILDGRPIAQPEARLFVSGQMPQHVWFWHLYDGRPIDYRDPRSPRALLKIAWQYGFSHDGDQLFVRVSSNRPWSELSDEPLVGEFLTRVQPFGL